MISEKEVEHIAHLARIDLTANEKKMFTDQLSQILQYMEQLNELDTTNVEPMAYPSTSECPKRNDVVKPNKDTQSILNLSPEKEYKYFKVKKIIE